MATRIDRDHFDRVEQRPLHDLPQDDDPAGDQRVYVLDVPDGWVRIGVSAPSELALDRFATSTFGAELVLAPNLQMTAVSARGVAASLRAEVESIVAAQGLKLAEVLAAMDKPSAAGIVNRVGGSVEALIVRAAMPFIERAHAERSQLPAGTRWVGPWDVLDYVAHIAEIGGLPGITGGSWPPRPPVSSDPDLTVDVHLWAQPAEGSDPEAVWELRYIVDPPVIRQIGYSTVDRYWLDFISLDMCFVAREGPKGINVFHRHGLGGDAGAIGENRAVSGSTWAWVTSLEGTVTYEQWGTALVSPKQPRFT